MRTMRKILLCFAAGLFYLPLAQAQSDEVKKQLVEQMIKDGDTSTSCVREEGGALQFLDVSLLHLNNDKQPEYLVTGKGCGCVGSIRCASSIYQKTAQGYKKIYRGEANEEIEVLKTRTRGYRNLRVTLISGSQSYSATIRFNGSRYQ